MKDPQRLSQDCTALEGAMLGSASLDVPPARLHENLQTALLAGASLGAMAASSAAAAQAGAAASSTATSVGATSGGIMAVKWIGIAVLGGALSVGVRAATSSRSVVMIAPTAASPAKPVTSLHVGAPGPSDRPPLVQPAVVEVTPPLGPVPLAPRLEENAKTSPPSARPSGVSTTAGTTPAPPRAPTDDFPGELALVDDARAALAAGDLPRVIERLDRHDLDFPEAHLAAEALALRVEAYAQKHDSARVRTLADAFIARYPDHPLLARIKSLANAASLP